MRGEREARGSRISARSNRRPGEPLRWRIYAAPASDVVGAGVRQRTRRVRSALDSAAIQQAAGDVRNDSLTTPEFAAVRVHGVWRRVCATAPALIAITHNNLSNYMRDSIPVLDWSKTDVTYLDQTRGRCRAGEMSARPHPQPSLI